MTKPYIRYRSRLRRRGYVLISYDRWNSNMKLQKEIYRLRALVRKNQQVQGDGLVESILRSMRRTEDTARIQNELYVGIRDRFDALERRCGDEETMDKG